VKILVTGGAGYVGGVTVDAILAAGHQVAILDDLSTGHRAIAHPDASLRVGTYVDTASVRAVLEEEAVDVILHCAARSLVPESIRDPARYYRENVAGGIALLEAAREAGVRRVVFSSTAAVYGTPETTPITEDAPLRPINPYGETKRTFEGALRWYGEAYGFRSVALRYFNVAGANGRLGEVHRPETHLIPNLLGALESGAPMTVYGDDYPTPDGTAIRDYESIQRRSRRVGRRAAGVQPGHRGGLLGARGACGRRDGRRTADPAPHRSAARGRSARPGGLERPGSRAAGLDPAALDAARDDRIGVGLAPGAFEGLWRLTLRSAVLLVRRPVRAVAGSTGGHLPAPG
jgi:UDP-glucose 4-epimerase